MSLRRRLAGQLAEQGRLELRIGSGRFSPIACYLSSCRSRACAIKTIGMQPYYIHSLPQRQPAASYSQPQQAIFSSAGLPGQLLQRLRGIRCTCSSTRSGNTVLWQGRSLSPCCRVGGPFSTCSSRPLGFSTFHTAPHHGRLQSSSLQQQLHRRQFQEMAELRAAFTSDAATQRVHLPQHLKDASLRKQASARSNAYSSAVAQARAGFNGSGYAHSQQLAEATRPAGTYSENVTQLTEGAEGSLAHEEQVRHQSSIRQSMSSDCCKQGLAAAHAVDGPAAADTICVSAGAKIGGCACGWGERICGRDNPECDIQG